MKNFPKKYSIFSFWYFGPIFKATDLSKSPTSIPMCNCHDCHLSWLFCSVWDHSHTMQSRRGEGGFQMIKFDYEGGWGSGQWLRNQKYSYFSQNFGQILSLIFKIFSGLRNMWTTPKWKFCHLKILWNVFASNHDVRQFLTWHLGFWISWLIWIPWSGDNWNTDRCSGKY